MCFFFYWFFDDGFFGFRVWLFSVCVCVRFFFFFNWFWFEGLVGGYGICVGGNVLSSLFGGFFLMCFGGWRGGGYCGCCG